MVWRFTRKECGERKAKFFSSSSSVGSNFSHIGLNLQTKLGNLLVFGIIVNCESHFYEPKLYVYGREYLTWKDIIKRYYQIIFLNCISIIDREGNFFYICGKKTRTNWIQFHWENLKFSIKISVWTWDARLFD